MINLVMNTGNWSALIISSRSVHHCINVNTTISKKLINAPGLAGDWARWFWTTICRMGGEKCVANDVIP